MQQIQINADDPATSDFLVLGGLQVSAALLLKHQPKAGRNREKYTPALQPQWPTPMGSVWGWKGKATGDWPWMEPVRQKIMSKPTKRRNDETMADAGSRVKNT